jgi:anti-sigma regulatory factor (Ser/Thr protein kinase)
VSAPRISADDHCHRGETRRGMVPVLRALDQSAPAAARWPLYAVLDLGALLTAPGCGRAWTQALLREWRLARLADTAQVVVSELLTNAVLASSGLDRAAIQLSLASDRERLLIFVRDFDPGAPAPRHASDDDETGRGLMLVEAISDRFGWHRATDGTPGKVVWAAPLKRPAWRAASGNDSMTPTPRRPDRFSGALACLMSGAASLSRDRGCALALGVYLCPRRMTAVHHHRLLPGQDRPVVLVAVVLVI